MKIISKSLLIFSIFFIVSCTTAPRYIIENFQEYQDKHETIAILPVEVTIDLANQPKGITQADLDRRAKDDSLIFQRLLQTYLIEQFGKGRYTIRFMDVEDTNTVLRRSNSFDDSGRINKTKVELNDLLKVDALLSTSIHQSKPMSDGGAIVTGLLFGVGMANKADINVSIHDGDTGVLLWNYENTLEGAAFTNQNQLIRSLVSAVSATFPYKKEKKN
tara:strand:+ start:199 stop:852 length:654 start_codon:yes stop_codon:yes gene_type:complete